MEEKTIRESSRISHSISWTQPYGWYHISHYHFRTLVIGRYADWILWWTIEILVVLKILHRIMKKKLFLSEWAAMIHSATDSIEVDFRSFSVSMKPVIWVQFKRPSNSSSPAINFKLHNCETFRPVTRYVTLFINCVRWSIHRKIIPWYRSLPYRKLPLRQIIPFGMPKETSHTHVIEWHAWPSHHLIDLLRSEPETTRNQLPVVLANGKIQKIDWIVSRRVT